MKLTKFQIIGLLLIFLGWFYQQPSDIKFVPNLQAEDLEANGVAGFLTIISSEGPVKPKPDPIGSTFIVEQIIEDTARPEQVEILQERRPRVIFMTQSVGCAPCNRVVTNVMDVLNTDKYKEMGWTVGIENYNTVQVLDYNTNEDQFMVMADKINNTFGRRFNLATPTFVRINKDGNIEQVKSGYMPLSDFIKFHRGE